MEYVIVEFDEDRAVFIDDQENGRTGENLRIGAGMHTFTLGGETNFTPASITTEVVGTSIIEPVIIRFGTDNV